MLLDFEKNVPDLHNFPYLFQHEAFHNLSYSRGDKVKIAIEYDRMQIEYDRMQNTSVPAPLPWTESLETGRNRAQQGR